MMHKGIIIFGTMGSGKDALGAAITDSLHGAGIFKLGKYIRTLGDLLGGRREEYQKIGQSMRENVDPDFWNKVTLSEINDQIRYPIICDGRQINEFHYWTEHEFLTIGINASHEIRKERLLARDGYAPSTDAFVHETEVNAHYVATQMCKVKIPNNTNELERLEVAAHSILHLIGKGENINDKTGT